MGGENPYIKKAQVKVAEKPYRITFRGAESAHTTVTIDPQAVPSGGTGLPGSVLDIAMGLGIDIDHACGGVVACSTCHVYVKQGLVTCNPATDDELDMLEKAPGMNATSRLACQCVASGEQDLVVEIPAWNRNAVREGH